MNIGLGMGDVIKLVSIYWETVHARKLVLENVYVTMAMFVNIKMALDHVYRQTNVRIVVPNTNIGLKMSDVKKHALT